MIWKIGVMTAGYLGGMIVAKKILNMESEHYILSVGFFTAVSIIVLSITESQQCKKIN